MPEEGATLPVFCPVELLVMLGRVPLNGSEVLRHAISRARGYTWNHCATSVAVMLWDSKSAEQLPRTWSRALVNVAFEHGAELHDSLSHWSRYGSSDEFWLTAVDMVSG